MIGSQQQETVGSPSPKNLTIIPASRAMVPFIVSLIHTVMADEGDFSRLQWKKTEEFFEDRLSEGRASIEVALLGETPVGFFDAERIGNDGLLLNLIGLEQCHRGRRFGHRVLARVEELAAELALSTIVLNSLPVPACRRAHSLYFQHGFAIAGLVEDSGVTFLKFEKLIRSGTSISP